MPCQDLRDFIAAVDALGALRRVDGADLYHEIGAITEVAAGMADCPALLFDHIKGVPPGFRILSNAVTSPQRAALALGIDPQLRPLDALKIDIVRNAWSSALDPRIPPDAKARGVTSHSKLIIEAVRPFAWIDRFPKLSALSHDDARATEAKWGEVLRGKVKE